MVYWPSSMLAASGVLAQQGVCGKWCTGPAARVLAASGVLDQQGLWQVVYWPGRVVQKTTASGALARQGRPETIAVMHLPAREASKPWQVARQPYRGQRIREGAW